MKIIELDTDQKKKAIIFSTVALIILSIACSIVYMGRKSYTYPAQLVAADSLCEANPAKALMLLTSMQKESAGMSEAGKCWREIWEY